jgi:hypothetical protein
VLFPAPLEAWGDWREGVFQEQEPHVKIIESGSRIANTGKPVNAMFLLLTQSKYRFTGIGTGLQPIYRLHS